MKKNCSVRFGGGGASLLLLAFGLQVIAPLSAWPAESIGALDTAGPVPWTLGVSREAGEMTLRFKGEKLLVYSFGAQQFKSYVKELSTLAGDNVLLDAPPDHLHHHGVMYAIKVNGHNFWEETAAAGYQRAVAPPEGKPGQDARGLPQFMIAHRLCWVANTNKADADPAPSALLLENRKLIVTVDERTQEVALAWQSEFEVGPAASRVTLSGSAYHGLGVRLATSWNKVARHQNSENLPYTEDQKWDLTPARWSAVSHSLGDREMTVALFNQPANQGVSKFFTMINPFTYLSATQNLEQTPIEYEAGDKFKVSYLLLTYTAKKSSESLHARYAAWLK
jgi:hypothetical protein